MKWSMKKLVIENLAGIPECSALKGHGLRAQGRPRFLAYPGKGCRREVNPEGVASGFNPFRVGFACLTTQGWRHNSPPTLGSVMLPFQGSFHCPKPILDRLGLEPGPTLEISF
jgi:hypothetical protein